ncbi:MAG: 3-phosphoglycerate dehydrogenase [Lachnospiraceae bacterium]|nr:3-phosphoglycerate dehydrogenase [Lachnospiraceae bacterium]
MYKINCLNPISQVGLADLTDDFHITDKIDDAEGVLVRSASMHEMELPGSLLAVARAGAGVNNIPLDKCAEKGIVVFNTPGANANGVKELVIAGMLLAARDIVGGIEWIKDNASDADIAKTAEKQKKNFAGTEIAGKKLGVIGLGAIGVKVANAALHLGMDVYGYDPYLSVNAAWNLSRNVHHVEKVEEIYKECDYITIHVPLLDSTKGTINRDAISQMKDGVVVINYARDLLVSETDMLEALKNGKVARYVSDFPNATTAGQPGVILTPHLGASTEESEDNCAKMAVEEIMDYLNNGNIRNSVNYPAIDMGPCDNKGRVEVFHKNQANMIAQFTSVFGAEKINISDMMNKSRGDYAVTLLDLDDVPTDSLVEKLSAAEGVLRVRVVKG